MAKGTAAGVAGTGSGEGEADVRAAFETHEELLEVRLAEAKADDAGDAETEMPDAESNAEILERVVALERDAEAHRKQLESDRKARDELKRELDVLAKLKSQAESATAKQVGLVRVNENSKKNLEREVAGYKSEAQRQAKALYSLETQREKLASEASAAHAKHLEALEEMKLRELENVDLLKQIADGTAQIVIGTHALLAKSVKFRDLGLLIIDEEHRFGVSQKEAMKSLRSEVDVLAMTAKPIPRTLNMAMSGRRDLSIIATPPARRLSVKTFVKSFDLPLVKEAILRELLRGGQVYYLHNDVKTIERTAERLRELVPEARVVVGHGQMRERELEKVMSDFYHKRFNVLVCSTIIETGIDVPNANTILIDRADKFGLAQLHQLRGRVGRSHHQAYAYLLTPDPSALSGDAVKRLEAITMATDLGAGFMLASHDLEIRGAGELLGDQQSGQMQTIGFSLYMEMLEEAVQAIREGREPALEKPLRSGVEVDIKVAALIPNDWLPDVPARLELYKRIAAAKSADALEDIRIEMVDRFGTLPDTVHNLLRQGHLRVRAKQLGLKRISAGEKGGKVEFAANTQVQPIHLIKLVQTLPMRYRMDGADGLKVVQDCPTPESRFALLEDLFETLKPEYAA